MANVQAIHSVGESLATRLRNAYPESLRARHPCDFRVVSSGELAGENVNFDSTLTLFLYRVTVNEHLRNARRINDPLDADSPMALDLHYLLTVWSGSALVEHTVLAWTLQYLHAHAVLDASSLSPEAGWERGDVIQLIPAELSTEDLMRIWDAIDPAYRLSVSYIARVVRIDPPDAPVGLPVVATRYRWSDRDGSTAAAGEDGS